MTENPKIDAGLGLIRSGQFGSAAVYFQRCLAEGGGPDAWFYLGVAQHRLGQLEKAVSSFAEAIAGAPDATEARCARATVLAALGRPGEAEAELNRALEQSPAHPQALFNLAVLVEQRGARDAALLLYDRALQAEPAHFAARLNRGALRLATEEAEAALADFDRLGSERAEVHTNRARALFLLHRDEEALAAAEAALAIEPGNARASLDKVIALASLGRLEEAAKARAACGLEATPDFDPFALYVGRGLARNAAGDWRGRAQLTAALRDAVREQRCDALTDPGMLIHALAYPLDEAEIRALADAVARGVRARAVKFPISPFGAALRRDARIRVGFLSPELRHHHGAFILRRLFRDRDRSRFEYFLYALNADDGSEIRRELQASADLFVDVSSWDAGQIAARLRGDTLDILLDRTGHFGGTRPEVLALRAAPIQVGFMGTPCTLGEGLLDYRLSDALTTPAEAQADWHERLVLLPPPHALFDADLATAARPGRRSDHGLPRDALVLCHFDLPFRIGPEVFDVWMRLLARVPQSVLWLLDGGKLANANLRRRAEERGVAGGRLMFAPATPYEAHFACLPHADLFLDTFHFGARSMAFDALRAGVPVLTCPGTTMASRLCVGFLLPLGLDELVAGSPADYERKALELATDAASLARVKQLVAATRNRSPVFDTVARVRAVERAFVAMVERHRAGLPPAMLTIV